jgi:hypothetical protein
MESPPTSFVDRWIARFVSLAIVLLMVALCILLWRTSMLIYRVEQSLAAISDDIRQVSSTAATVARQVDEVLVMVDELKERSAEMAHREELRSLKEEAVLLGSAIAEPVERQAGVDEDIAFLLREIRNFKGTFADDDDNIRPRQFWLKMRVKHQTYKRTIGSTQDWIDNIATTTIAGRPYYVQHEDGRREPLPDWLRQRLDERYPQ